MVLTSVDVPRRVPSQFFGVHQLSSELFNNVLLYKIGRTNRKLVLKVLDDPRFRRGYGAPLKKDHPNPHHAFPGGLYVHTAEVLGIALRQASALPEDEDFNELSILPKVNLDVLILAAIYHDYAKIFDYDDWGQETDYKKKIYHIVGSFQFWMEQASSMGAPQELITEVGHCILAHHGRYTWKSPREPQTLEAQILHNADLLSAQYGPNRGLYSIEERIENAR